MKYDKSFLPKLSDSINKVLFCLSFRTPEGCEESFFKSSRIPRFARNDTKKSLNLGGTKDKDQLLPPLKEKDTADVIKTEIEKKQTTPPPRYTDASILSAMTNAQRFVKDEELKKILKETAGLGTTATRAAILETLKNRGYIERKGKTLIPTEKGIFLINAVKDEKIADPAYTALWGQELDAIPAGEVKSSNSLGKLTKDEKYGWKVGLYLIQRGKIVGHKIPCYLMAGCHGPIPDHIKEVGRDFWNSIKRREAINKRKINNLTLVKFNRSLNGHKNRINNKSKRWGR